MQTDITGLVSQLKDLQRKNADLEESNTMLSSKVIIMALIICFGVRVNMKEGFYVESAMLKFLSSYCFSFKRRMLRTKIYGSA